ncbi:hypothetical protein IFM89_035078 [Coptis chinensis]|uniref:Uncharacterized protein n=1 Tax=Coptis chinensis TaxID=261450 RepID=A0A835IGC0_9MAGN|nr:hypothetical protein IFM89_035078 [Coptis chinensis]
MLAIRELLYCRSCSRSWQVATCAAIIIAIRINRSREYKMHNVEGDGNSLPISTAYDYVFDIPDDTPENLPNMSPPMLALRSPPSVRHGTAGNSNKIISSTRRARNPVTAKTYTVAELQSATNSFSKNHLLGVGSRFCFQSRVS